MATILLTWELGGAWGHLMRLKTIGLALCSRGHEVSLAVRDLPRAQRYFENTSIRLLQAPLVRIPPSFERLNGFVDILAQSGFSDEPAMRAVFERWNAAFDAAAPDLVIADYSPLALLALRGRAIPTVNMGLPFYCPPDVSPLPPWPTRLATESTQQMDREKELLQKMSQLLELKRRPALERLSQLFHQHQEVILASYPEFDPYGLRAGVRYWGHWEPDDGTSADWPAVSGPKIFAYLENFPAFEELLNELRRIQASTIIVAKGVNPQLLVKYANPMLRFETRPLNMRQVAAECDLAILHAGHGTLASILLAGKPCLLFPIFIEQFLNAQAATRLGAARWLAPSARGKVGKVLQEMLNSPRYRQQAGQFAARYRSFVPGKQIPELVQKMEGLIPAA